MSGTVHFTGLAVEPDDILRPRLNRGVIPVEWSLRQVEVPILDSQIEPWRIDAWLAEQIEGRWSVLSYGRISGLLLVIAFERPEDATLFALMNGAREMLDAIRPER